MSTSHGGDDRDQPPPGIAPAVADDAPVLPLAPEPDALFGADHDDAPPLVISTEEPPEVPSSDARALSSAETLRTLRKLAGETPGAPAARQAIRAALRGAPYDRAHLPDARAIALGTARAALAHGVDLEALVEAIVAALGE